MKRLRADRERHVPESFRKLLGVLDDDSNLFSIFPRTHILPLETEAHSVWQDITGCREERWVCRYPICRGQQWRSYAWGPLLARVASSILVEKRSRSSAGY